MVPARHGPAPPIGARITTSVQVTRRTAIALGAVGLLGACGRPATPASKLADRAEHPKQGGWTPIVPNSDLAVGRNRFLYAVLDERNRPILDAQIHLRFFDRVDAPGDPKAEVAATFRGQGLGDKGIYVSRVELPTAGTWGVEAAIQRPDGTTRTLRTRFEVKTQSQTLAVGSNAIPSRQPLMAGAPDPRAICTAVPACALHDLTIADALAARTPSLLLFATPGFCTSATCGPDLQTVLTLEPAFRGRVSFAHLEIYSDPATLAPTETVKEWRLPSEPWVFLLDREGRVADKLEGALTVAELREGLERLL
jgi:hypothetical protein